MLLHQVIDGPLATVPDELAVISGDDGAALSFFELSRRAGAYARRFVDLGLGRGDRVALVAHKSPDVIAAILGASRVGVIYVPLDMQASPSYWVMVLEDLQVLDVFTNVAGVADKLKEFRVHGLELDSSIDSDVDLGGPGDSLPARTTDDDAYILATSGSTGRPKGVLLSHGNALSFVDWAVEEVALGPGDRVLNVAPFHFDLSVFDIFGTLRRGARLVLAPSMALMFPGQLIAAIDEHKISVLYTVPTVLRMLLEAGAFDGGGGGSLRTIIYAGEPFPVAALARLMQALPDVEFFNFFGPTETNVCLAHLFDRVPALDSEVCIGRPASGARVTLVDVDGAEVSRGDIGELMVDGPTVMKGYIKADGFRACSRPYATGDFATQGEDGAYYFRGRRDQQVKVRGARVELASVEHALGQAEGVKEAVALVVGHDLVGFVAGEQLSGERQLRKVCVGLLTPGAVPHKIVSLACLPRLSNGKLDLARLKALASEDC